MAQGCARIDSRLDAAKIGSAGRVEVHRDRLFAAIEVRKTFPHGLGPKLTLRKAAAMSASEAIMLQKSFGCDERNFPGPLMRIIRKDVRDHIAYQKNDHGASYRPCGALQQQKCREIIIHEIFRGHSIFDFCYTIGG